MNKETQELLNVVTTAISEAVWNIGDGEEATKMIVKAITKGVAEATYDTEDAEAVLKDISYWSQPWINPYYDEDNEQQ